MFFEVSACGMVEDIYTTSILQAQHGGIHHHDMEEGILMEIIWVYLEGENMLPRRRRYVNGKV
jgi:hypothetical protein